MRKVGKNGERERETALNQPRACKIISVNNRRLGKEHRLPIFNYGLHTRPR